MKGAWPILFALVIALPMFSSPAAAIEPGGLYGGTVTVAVLDDLNTNPATAGAADLEFLALAYDSLAKRSPTDSTPVPWLALNWSVLGSTVTFYLRDGATWADGNATPLTAEDIAHAYNTIYNLGVTATAGTGTVSIAFTANGGTFWADGVYLPIAWKNGQSTRQPGSGPYTVGESVADDHVTFTANLNHWSGRPYLDAVTFKVFPHLAAAACGVIQGEATVLGFPLVPNDLTDIRYCDAARPTEFTTLLNETRLTTTRNPGLTQLYLGMNSLPGGPLADPDLRRGIAGILDKDLHNTIEPSAYNDIADSLVVPGNFYWFNPSVPRYRMDKTVVGTTTLANFDRVNRELDLAGFLDRDSDGWREDKSGTPFPTFRYLVPSVAVDPRKFTIAQNLETNLGRIGVKITTEQLDFATIESRVAANTFELYVGLATVERDPAFYFDLFHSSQVPTGKNLVNLNAPALDALLVGMRDEVDPDQRRAHAWDVQQWVGDNVPWAPILHYRHIDVTNKTQYTGWVNSVGGVNNFWSYTNLHVLQQGALEVTISTSSAKIEGGKPAVLVVSVVDSAGTPVAGVSLELTATDGTFDLMVGATDTGGLFTTNYNPPSPATIVDVSITAMASRPGYDLGTAEIGLSITPPRRQIRVTIERPTDPRIPSGGSAALTVTVLDGLSAPIPGASVRLTLSPANFGGTLTPTTGVTNATGHFSFTFSGDVSVETSFRITAEVSASGFPAGTASTNLLVAPHAGSFQEPPTTPGPEAVLLMVVTGALALAYARLRRRRPDEA